MTIRPFASFLAAGALAIALGIGTMLAYGAPSGFIAINGIALVLAIGLAPIARMGRGASMDRLVVGITLAALLATLAVGPDLDGVRRWLQLGPVRLHIAMMLVPAFAVAVARLEAGLATGALCVVALLVALQPDLATAIALLAVALAGAAFAGGRIRWLGVLGAALAVLWCVSHPDTLEPVRFVEHVLTDTAATNAPLAIALAAVLALAIVAPLRGWARTDPTGRAASATFAACLAGYAAASLIGPYPTPLIGAGAASILGWGLALGRLHAPVGTSAPSR